MIFVVVCLVCLFILLLACCVCVCVCKVLSILYIIFSCNEIDWNEIGSHRFLTQFYRRFLELLEKQTIWFLSKNVLLIKNCTLHSWFIFDFIVLPLAEIMRKNVRFHWTNVELKWLFGIPNTNWFLDHLYLFDNWTWPFNTMVDAASVGICSLHGSFAKKDMKEYLPFILRLTEQLDRIDAIWVFTHFLPSHWLCL